MPSAGSMSYVQIADDLENKIHKGKLRPGMKLPSYSELAVEYEVSVNTIKTALAILRDRGVVVGRPGIGVFVADD